MQIPFYIIGRYCKNRKGVIAWVISRVDRWRSIVFLMAMPRKLRIEYPGAMYHVMSRGDRRERIFLDLC